MAPNGIRHKADAFKRQIPKPKLSVPKPGGESRRHPPTLLLSRPRQLFIMIKSLEAKHVKGYFAML